ncbi:hypothetical protein [Roseobacter ponti]|uniref:Flagellar FliJ protein n=1 Tax=Roseobacter ponti TaxID=1891787 RepID=A0A858SY43_9RHOB|nr:hypothetical protein [Roseobacter ponti]QJF52977.1 hypothetical protein G3256_18240 [Roseobacter ponti]
MTSDKLPGLQRIVETRYMIQRRELSVLLAKEGALRAELMKLDEYARAPTSDDAGSMRAIGADVIWKSWVGRKKTQLNIQLARILAQKDHHLRQVRKAYGKVLVVSELSDRDKQKTRKRRSEAQLRAAIEMSVNKRFNSC